MSVSEREPLLGDGHKTCPVTGKTGDSGHEFVPPMEGDVRSVCPAINAMANHGYIPHDGKGVTPWMIFRGLRACYGLSIPLALTLTGGGWFFNKRYFGQAITLVELGLHNGVEHDASVVHGDTPVPPPVVGHDGKVTVNTARKGLLAPVAIIPALVEEFISSIVKRASLEASTTEFVTPTTLPESAVLITGHDIVQTRLRREAQSPPLDPFHAELARGEMSIILGVWETQKPLSPLPSGSPIPAPGIPLPWMRHWLAEERLPDGWKPTHVQGLRDVIRRSTAMRKEMKAIREGK
ncbi:HEME-HALOPEROXIDASE domain-containing protein [Mycena indigotica]|uniref:HEME-HALOPEROXIDASE domain-containing protein n=1 Tax=Mycena indigotica TaxID=2126181 RepID=A0A8H6VR66_9AGAR|nr:HEME-HALOPEROXIDASE domain-containing protein [Mycena indigotica]KAF7288991.1 HEME-HALOPEROXIDASE domain-containing protein [Mycena indigotica]